MTKYEPQSFWNTYAEDLDKNGVTAEKYNIEAYTLQNRELIELLKNLKFESVVEIGSGIGRVTKMVLDNFPVQTYTIIDISQNMLSQLLRNVDMTKLQTFNAVLADISNWMYIDDIFKNRRFDLVLTVEVLMHIKPEHIQNVIDSMMYLSKKHIVHLDYSVDEEEDLEYHNFNHDYKNMWKRYCTSGVFKRVDTISIQNLGDTKQRLFHIEVI